MISDFRRKGFYGPVKLLTHAQCARLVTDSKSNDLPLIPDWDKAWAVNLHSFYRIATRPEILNTVREILGNDVMLWGASIVKRKPGQKHVWHNDVETSVEKGKTVSVWIGLRNTTQRSSLQLITHSHAFKESIQEVQHKLNADRNNTKANDIIAWAKTKDSECELFIPNMGDGDALFFDGWIWHASDNTGNRTRTALLLQYATPDTPIRIPDPNSYAWPFKTLTYPKPPCIMVSGSDHSGVNRIVSGPASHDGYEKQVLTHVMYSLPLPLKPEGDQSWKPFSVFRGSTPNLQGITCHASALNPGYTPHPPHQHKEEEILMLLSGEADLTLPDLAAKGQSTVVPMKAGDFVYYPAWFYHTITAKGTEPANYLMLKWYNGNQSAVPVHSPQSAVKAQKDQSAARDEGKRSASFIVSSLQSPIKSKENKLAVGSLQSAVKSNTTESNGQVISGGKRLEYAKNSVFDILGTTNASRNFNTKLILQEPTDCLETLQCHTSVMLPGGGYTAHADAHDVAIITLKGEIEVLGEKIAPYSVLFFAAGQLHDLKNSGAENAEYLVFEFHGNHPAPVKRRKRSLWEKMQDPKAWRDKIKEIKRLIN